jgi:hypothetical protein
MIDSLFVRAQLAIEESRALQSRSRALHAEQDAQRDRLRSSIFESAMLRSETKALRENKE